jgi:hypothetical protein
MGFIEETGVAQHYRDARIMPIYEGTTAIQSNDLIGRKVIRNQGATAAELFAQVEQTVADLRDARLLDEPHAAVHLDGVARECHGILGRPALEDRDEELRQRQQRGVGLGAVEQQAQAYAADRIQGRVLGRDGVAPIAEHPDVRRLLLSMRSDVFAMRALGVYVADLFDRAESDPALLPLAEFFVPILKDPVCDRRHMPAPAAAHGRRCPSPGSPCRYARSSS